MRLPIFLLTFGGLEIQVSDILSTEGNDSTHTIEFGSAGRTSLEWHRLAGLSEANLACAAGWGDVDKKVAQAYGLCHLRRAGGRG